jgi:hypothetical protein
LQSTQASPKVAQPNKKPDLVAFLPYFGLIFKHISRVLSQNIKSMGFPLRKMLSFLQSVRDDLELKASGVYSISCECGQVYIGQTGRLIDTRLKEHWQDICLEHLDKSALVEHSINLGQHTAILSTKPRYIDCIIREVIEIELHPNSVNREDGFCLSK